MKNSTPSRRQAWITTYRVTSLALLVALVAIGSALLVRPSAPTETEIAQAVKGLAEFQRPGAMEYVAKTNSCVVGGTVTESTWYVDSKPLPAGSNVDLSSVDYTTLEFRADNGQEFTASKNGALVTPPGSNLGLEVECDTATMNVAESFGIRAIIYGGA
jgi:hypothetical protein